MERIQVCFNIAENVVAQKGNTNVYLRIAGSDGKIMLGTASKFFNYQGKEIAYSAVKNVNYSGDLTEVCMFWETTQEYPTGKYTVDIFAQDNKIGTQSFELK